MKAMSALNLCLKFSENRRNIQKIYDSLRKELQDECHCPSSLLKVTRTRRFGSPRRWLRSWLAHRALLLKVLLVWNHNTSRQGCVYCSKSEGIKPIILVSCLVHSSKYYAPINVKPEEGGGGHKIIVKISRNKWFTSHLLFEIDRSNAWCQVKIPTLGICLLTYLWP